jgi:hypothetical protein
VYIPGVMSIALGLAPSCSSGFFLTFNMTEASTFTKGDAELLALDVPLPNKVAPVNGETAGHWD